MANVTVVSTCTIRHNWHARYEATGKYDNLGNMIMRSKAEVIAPDTIFEMEDGEELNRLRGLEAVRDATETEILMWERSR